MYQFGSLGIRPEGTNIWESVLPEGISLQGRILGKILEGAQSFSFTHDGSGEIRLRCCLFSLLLGSPGTIASEGSTIPQVHWTCADRLCQVRDSVLGQSVFLCQRQGIRASQAQTTSTTATRAVIFEQSG